MDDVVTMPGNVFKLETLIFDENHQPQRNIILYVF